MHQTRLEQPGIVVELSGRDDELFLTPDPVTHKVL